jgi:hypothetical protein
MRLRPLIYGRLTSTCFCKRPAQSKSGYSSKVESRVVPDLKMAVPPHVANVEAQACLNRVADIEGPPSLRAARSSQRLRLARELQAVNGITEAELGEHEGFHTRCALRAAGPAVAVEEAIADVPGVPPWFGPAMTAALQPVQAQLNNIQAQVNDIGAQVNNIQAQVNNIQAQVNDIGAQVNTIEAQVTNNEARIINSVASYSLDPLVALINQAGVAFADFPANFSSLVSLNGVQMTAILNHYGLPAWGNNQAKLQRIKKFIGMRIG